MGNSKIQLGISPPENGVVSATITHKTVERKSKYITSYLFQLIYPCIHYFIILIIFIKIDLIIKVINFQHYLGYQWHGQELETFSKNIIFTSIIITRYK